MRLYWELYARNLYFNLPIISVLFLLAVFTPLGYGAAVGWTIGSFIGSWIAYRMEKHDRDRLTS